MLACCIGYGRCSKLLVSIRNLESYQRRECGDELTFSTEDRKEPDEQKSKISEEEISDEIKDSDTQQVINKHLWNE